MAAIGHGLKTHKRPTTLADMPAFYGVTITDVAPHRQGLMYVVEFDPLLSSKAGLAQASDSP